MIRNRTNALLIDPRDNVAVALEDIPAGSEVSWGGGASMRAIDSIRFAHKIAIDSIALGESILKYGAPIAFATAGIRTGEWVHEHNAKSFFVAKREAGQ